MRAVSPGDIVFQVLVKGHWPQLGFSHHPMIEHFKFVKAHTRRRYGRALATKKSSGSSCRPQQPYYWCSRIGSRLPVRVRAASTSQSRALNGRRGTLPMDVLVVNRSAAAAVPLPSCSSNDVRQLRFKGLIRLRRSYLLRAHDPPRRNPMRPLVPHCGPSLRTSWA